MPVVCVSNEARGNPAGARLRRWYLCVSLAPQFTQYTVNCTSRDSISHLLTYLVVYIIARCSSLNTTTFCLIRICNVLPHPTLWIEPAYGSGIPPMQQRRIRQVRVASHGRRAYYRVRRAHYRVARGARGATSGSSQGRANYDCV
jgi:hypothetical protein